MTTELCRTEKNLENLTTDEKKSSGAINNLYNYVYPHEGNKQTPNNCNPFDRINVKSQLICIENVTLPSYVDNASEEPCCGFNTPCNHNNKETPCNGKVTSPPNENGLNKRNIQEEKCEKLLIDSLYQPANNANLTVSNTTSACNESFLSASVNRRTDCNTNNCNNNNQDISVSDFSEIDEELNEIQRELNNLKFEDESINSVDDNKENIDATTTNGNKPEQNNLLQPKQWKLSTSKLAAKLFPLADELKRPRYNRKLKM